jgi:hypothetical protein
MNQPIDWKHVNKRVATMKARGVDFLSVAMGG